VDVQSRSGFNGQISQDPLKFFRDGLSTKTPSRSEAPLGALSSNSRVIVSPTLSIHRGALPSWPDRARSTMVGANHLVDIQRACLCARHSEATSASSHICREGQVNAVAAPGARQQIDTCNTTSRAAEVVEYPCKCFARAFVRGKKKASDNCVDRTEG
jgi:hypothetical protein